MNHNRLCQQIAFIIEIDKLKSIIRRSYIIDNDRFETAAEHSWHLPIMAIILHEYSDEPIDLMRLIKMLLIHDIVEIYAGDTFYYDDIGRLDKKHRESQAADRIFKLLPADQGKELRDLWEEYEARNTPEAKFASALDRLMPLLQSYQTKGKSWKLNGITSDRVMMRNSQIKECSRKLWKLALSIIEDAVKKGYLSNPDL